MRVTALVRQITLGAFALWLGLWPAGDAITGTSQTLIVLAPAAEEPAPSCGHDPAAAVPCASATTACGASSGEEASQGGSDAEANCARARLTCADAKPACVDTKAARCGQCSCISGLVLFATAPLRIDPDLEPMDTLNPSNRFGLSHSIQPPVRPPAVVLPIIA